MKTVIREVYPKPETELMSNTNVRYYVDEGTWFDIKHHGDRLIIYVRPGFIQVEEVVGNAIVLRIVSPTKE